MNYYEIRDRVPCEEIDALTVEAAGDIIAEMQADSRIVAELARMSARKKEGGA